MNRERGIHPPFDITFSSMGMYVKRWTPLKTRTFSNVGVMENVRIPLTLRWCTSTRVTFCLGKPRGSGRTLFPNWRYRPLTKLRGITLENSSAKIGKCPLFKKNPSFKFQEFAIFWDFLDVEKPTYFRKALISKNPLFFASGLYTYTGVSTQRYDRITT